MIALRGRKGAGKPSEDGRLRMPLHMTRAGSLRPFARWHRKRCATEPPFFQTGWTLHGGICDELWPPPQLGQSARGFDAFGDARHIERITSARAKRADTRRADLFRTCAAAIVQGLWCGGRRLPCRGEARVSRPVFLLARPPVMEGVFYRSLRQ